MANDRETKSFEVKPERPQDSSAAIRAGGGDTMAGGKDADLRPHKEAGSSGTGLPPMPDSDMRIDAQDVGHANAKSNDSPHTGGSSPGRERSQERGADDDR